MIKKFRKTFFSTVFVISLQTIAACLILAVAPTVYAEPFRIVAYVPNWIELDSFSKSIDYKNLTHINIAFENPINEQGELSFHAKNALLIESAQQHNVKVLVSIGGGSASENKKLKSLYSKLLSPERRANFVKALTDYVKLHHFDGLDVDIEGASINADYSPFVEELATAFHKQGLLLTAAVSQGYGGQKISDSALARFDFVNIMAYDAAGSWNPNEPGQHSTLSFAQQNVEYWLDRGLLKSKAVLGLPFYGYGFGEEFHSGGLGYEKIVSRFPGAENVDQVGNTIWYNGQPTIQAKTQYAIGQQLGGVMIWSLDNDVFGDKSLLGTIGKTLSDR